MTSPTNLKPRLVWCQRCRTDEISDQPEPRCHVCDERLITVVYSALTGKRMTGRSFISVAQAVGNPNLVPGVIR